LIQVEQFGDARQRHRKSDMRTDGAAEGVENFEQVMHLRALGVRSAQGYVFAPLPGSSFLELVEAIDPLQPAAALRPRLPASA